jgi:hypothetical protein
MLEESGGRMDAESVLPPISSVAAARLGATGLLFEIQFTTFFISRQTIMC